MKARYTTHWLIYGSAPCRMDEVLLDLDRAARESDFFTDPFIYLASNPETWQTVEALEADQGFCRDATLALRAALERDGMRMLAELPAPAAEISEAP